MTSTINQIAYDNLQDELVIDIRDNTTFRQGHLPNSLNVTAKQKDKYWDSLVKDEAELVLVTEDEPPLVDFEDSSAKGYILFADIPQANLVTSSEITAEDFLQLDGNYTLLDLRHPDEITRPAPKKNLVNIPLENLADNLDQIDSDKDIYLLCGSGGRATAGDAYLKSHGFDHTHVIEGGIKAVIQAQDK